MRKKAVQVLVLVCATMLMLSFLTVDAVVHQEKREIVYIRISSPEDIYLLRNAGASILHRYPDHALVEIDETILEELGLSVNPLKHRTMVYVKGWSFDVTEGLPDISSNLYMDGYPRGTNGLYIVHMIGPVCPDWVHDMEAMGVEIINYVPYFAYEVRMTPEQAEQVKDLYFVDWVGVYQPAFKLAPDLEPGLVSVRLTDGVSFDSLNTVMSGLNAHFMTELTTYGAQVVGKVEDEVIFHELARMPDVYYISNHVENELLDEIATQVIGGGCWYWDPDDDPSSPFRLSEGGEPPYAGNAGSLANQLGYTGAGVVTAVADTGIGDGTVGDAGHLDFTGRVLGGYSFDTDPNDWRDQHSHGTHCAGSAGGDTYHGTGSTMTGGYYSGQGSAPETEFFAVQIFDGGGSWVGPNDYFEIIEVPSQMADAYVHTNSWGGKTGGSYFMADEAFDTGARDSDPDTPGNQPMVIAAAAGNNDGYNGINSPANGKNVITVGATRNYGNGGPDSIAGFSNRGWTEDRRIKPDLMAPGEGIYSTMPGGGYGTKSGTSMSTPAVAGAAAVVVEWYEENHGYRPSPAMVKALMINTANDMATSDRIPNRNEGWGMVNLPRLVQSPVDFVLLDQTSRLTTGAVDEYYIEAEDTDEPFKISLVWTDKNALHGDSSGGIPTLKNNLDLEVESPSGDVYRGNAFSQTGSSSSDTGFSFANTPAMELFDHNDDGWDNVNNVLNVYIHPDDLEDGFYTIRIIGTHVPSDANNDGRANQDYALVAYNGNDDIPGDPPEITLESPVGGESFQAYEDELVWWEVDAGDDPIEHINLYYTTDAGYSWNTIVSELQGTTEYLWTVPNIYSPECMIKVEVRDTALRVSHDVSGEFTINGIPPAPPENLHVEHTGFAYHINEDFQDVDGRIPEGWDVSGDRWDRWRVQDTNLAGGVAPELVLEIGSGGSYINNPYIQTYPIDTTGQDELDLSFRHYVAGGTWSREDTFKVMTSTDGSTWTDAWEVSGIDIPATEVSVTLDDTHGVGSETLYLSWQWPTGWPNTLDSWNIDDVLVSWEEPDGNEHNLLTWDASADDPQEVSHYNIYRSEHHSGPWDENTFIDRVTADGSAHYEYTDVYKGLSDDTYWWYVVRAVGYNDMKEDNEDATYEPGGGEPPSIDIIRPTGGEIFEAYDYESIQWSTEQGDDIIDSINLWYSADAGSTWISIDSGLDDSGNHLWEVPNVDSTQCMVRARVKDIAGRTGQDISGMFSIDGVPPAPPSNLAVEHHGAGLENNLISWDASTDDPGDVSHYNIYRSEYQTGPWDESTFIDSVDADGSPDYDHVDEDKGMPDGIFWWYLVRAVGDTGIEDENNDAVQEPGEGSAPGISVTRPSGGEIFDAGTQEEITWDSQEGEDQIDFIDIWYSADGGSSWTSSASGIDDTGAHLWTVPDEHSEECLVRIRVTDIMGRTSQNVSADYFSIQGVPPASPENLNVEHHGIIGFTPIEEDFEDVPLGHIPEGWSVIGDRPDAWGVRNTDLAGGNAPELVLEPGTGSGYINNPYIRTSPIDSSGETELELSFRHYVADGTYSWEDTFKVMTSTDGSTWTDAWEVSGVNIPATEVSVTLVDTHGVGSETLYLSWQWTSGWPNTLDKWNIDDIVLAGEYSGDGDQHNLLTWDASTDDPDKLSNYNIYRSESSYGPWDASTLIHMVEADGSSSYEYIDEYKGMADDIFWWYVVRGVGDTGIEEDNTDAVREPGAETSTMDIELFAHEASDGWNFVSFGLEVSDPDLTAILDDEDNGISGSYDRVMWYDASQGEWLTYVPGRPEHFNNLNRWDHRMGVWIRMTGDDLLTVEGTEPTSTTLILEPGWNMVGLPSNNSGNHGLPVEVDRIGYFQATEDYNVVYTTDVSNFVFEPGKGYWIYSDAEEPVVWTVSY